jgi:2-oxoglutarate dehydrogenase E1 component
MIDKFSYLNNTDPNWIEEQYLMFLKTPDLTEPSWRQFFEGFEFSRKNYQAPNEIPENVQKEFKVINLINGYRNRGHLFTKTNPVRERRKYTPTLGIENFGLEEKDLVTVFQAGNEVGIGASTLQEIIKHLQLCYCQSVGTEFIYIRDPERYNWLRNKIEKKEKNQFSPTDKKNILVKLSRASTFEQFLHKKFVGQKRFSIEGGESLIPSLDAIIQKGSSLGVQEFVIGMAHRGRVNALVNIFQKNPESIFNEFEGKEYEAALGEFDGDVKYHLGYSTDVTADNGESVHLTLSPNPSHLEAVDPIVEGITRAKIDQYLLDEKKIVPILIHGDAAIAGQGIVYEIIQMAHLDGYKTGGTIHLVVNNQVGFTTNYLDGRSSTYCTDIAKTTLCPVFHVNGDDIEAMVHTMQLAIEYRQTYNRDVFVDILCYRKYGHNEGDEPKFTQPKLYDIIAKHPNPREIYTNQLIAEGVIDQSFADKLKSDFETELEAKYVLSKTIMNVKVEHFLEETWKNLRLAKDEDFENSPETSFDKKKLVALANQISTLPKGKNFFKKIVKLMEDRLNMIKTDSLDWALGETLAYATLLQEGFPVRVSGQDVERGTFSHRHAVVVAEDTEEEYIPLSNIDTKQAKFTIYNSLLSEYGVLGFDYGYAFACPNGLTIWEAQFGDFNNGAQIIIDQFISSAEDKWRTMNGLVMLLPHGYEGQGSEHSSARLERFLILCAENNMQVCNCTTPANFFHLLRRQLHRDFRKPLIVFTPKKLLRYPKAVSKMDDLANGRFKEIIDDTSVKTSNVDTIAFCSGKIYYDILAEKEKYEGVENIAVVRIEQLYPLPLNQIKELIAKYGDDKKYIWVQEEPENMGAWGYLLRVFREVRLDVIAHPASGSPAAGSSKVAEARQKAIINKLFKFAKQAVK